MENKKAAFTLIEVIVGMVIAVIIMAAAVAFFSFGYKQMDTTMKTSRGSISIFNVLEIIDSDLRKAGYGNVAAITGTAPVSGNGSEIDPLTIKFVDYTEPTCDNATWNPGDPCSYIVKYYFKNSNIYRYVDKGANNPSSILPAYPMFDSKIVNINSFNVTINATSHIVSYTIEGKVKDKAFSIGDEVICRNW
ncbi:prepilin-type N-terminal cleavage/methylation domain-containing protein [Desulfurobacterium sp.]